MSQISALAEIFRLFPDQSQKRITVRIRTQPDPVIDVQVVDDDLGVALCEREISIGSERRGVDERYELVDFKSPEEFATISIDRFSRILARG